MYHMCSDKLFSDEEFPIKNMDKIEKVYKLVEVDVSEVESLSNTKRFLNFKKDKAYCNKLRKSHFQKKKKNQNNGRYGQGNGKHNQKKKFQKLVY
ncbi:hypothetical protein Hanom_Chr05g00400821 [Helianthus anomalus]